MLLALYSLALSLALIIGAPFWLFRMATSGKYREGLAGRLGRVPAGLRRATDGKPVIWVHAVSVGEVLAASGLIVALREQSECAVVVSTTTRTGQRLARERFGAETVFYFPFDFAFAVRAYLRALQPRMLVLLETEFWPRLMVECRRSGIPIAVVNARISDRSWPRYRRLRFLWRHLLGSLAAALAQSPLDAERLQALGAANVQVAGNLKYDIRITRPAAIAETIRQQIAPGAAALVCGSTMEGEEQAVLAALPAGVVTILAPRHPERFEAVAQLLTKSGRVWHRRSTWAKEPVVLAPGSILLLDSIGELAAIYALATVAFVGGSLASTGGHNPLEPAQFGVPVMMGPHYQNFRGIVEALRSEDALRIAATAELQSALTELFAQPEEARRMGERARAVFEREAGATDRAVSALLTVLRGAQ